MEEFSNLCVPTQELVCHGVEKFLLISGTNLEKVHIAIGIGFNRQTNKRGCTSPYSTLGLNSQRTNISKKNSVELAVPSHAFLLRDLAIKTDIFSLWKEQS